MSSAIFPRVTILRGAATMASVHRYVFPRWVRAILSGRSSVRGGGRGDKTSFARSMNDWRFGLGRPTHERREWMPPPGKQFFVLVITAERQKMSGWECGTRGEFKTSERLAKS